MLKFNRTLFQALITISASLGIIGCQAPTQTAEEYAAAARYQAKLEMYPIQTKQGKQMRIIPAADYLLFKELPTPEAPTPKGTSIVVDTGNQRTWLYKDGMNVLVASICPGKVGKETPKGTFRVISKHKDWISTIYNVPMPYLLRLNAGNGAIGLHAGTIALQPASHGCIRLPEPYAIAFFNNTPVGTPVVIY